jgi:hypothetical protein
MINLTGQLWMKKGGKAEHLRRAVKAPYRFGRMWEGGPLYVLKPDASEPEPARVAPVSVLRDDVRLHVSVRHVPKEVDGVHEHEPFCECEWCE